MSGDAEDLSRLRVLGDYQFGADVGSVLFPAGEDLSIERSRSGRPRQIIADAGRIGSLTTLGRLTLGLEGGKRLHSARPSAYHVAVSSESDPYIREGKNAFAKFVRSVDSQVRPGDEVCVENESGDLLGVGRAALAAGGMEDFETGVAVSIRHGAESKSTEPGDPA